MAFRLLATGRSRLIQICGTFLSGPPGTAETTALDHRWVSANIQGTLARNMLTKASDLVLTVGDTD
ncbi:hypothetical protein GCM10009574_071380 [Streptomyces asiaticus]|uniref:Uncharacterized protein n=2 Tax=Streptomyces rhizosphaericus TaxID=114699 RepID=A0ABN1SES9_9ACTN